MDKIFFSIITVTYNAEEFIRETIESVIAQEFKNYEIIFVDGSSTDNTLKIINEYRDVLCNVRIVSERDKGIYDAMNKGAKIANGEYIYYLNAGDYLVNSKVLLDVADFISSNKNNNKEEKIIYHGEVVRNQNIVHYPLQYKEWKWIYLEHAYFCHQAIFASRSIFENYKFDISYKVCADRDWLINVMRNGGKYIYMKGIVIANYAEGGVSSGYESQQREMLEIVRKYGGVKAYFFVKIKRKIGEMIGHER